MWFPFITQILPLLSKYFMVKYNVDKKTSKVLMVGLPMRMLYGEGIFITIYLIFIFFTLPSIPKVALMVTEPTTYTYSLEKPTSDPLNGWRSFRSNINPWKSSQ